LTFTQTVPPIQGSEDTVANEFSDGAHYCRGVSCTIANTEPLTRSVRGLHRIRLEIADHDYPD